MPAAASTRRQEAQRNLETIVDAAVEVLGRRPDANMTDVARASGLSRQTVYAHFASREQLIDAAVGRAMDQAVARIDSVSPDEGRPQDALRRVLDVSWSSVATHGALLDAALSALPPETSTRATRPLSSRFAG
jgi:AcrR family transcriptional regulator